MKIDFRSLWKKILNPPNFVKVLTVIVTLVSATLSLVMLWSTINIVFLSLKSVDFYYNDYKCYRCAFNVAC